MCIADWLCFVNCLDFCTITMPTMPRASQINSYELEISVYENQSFCFEIETGIYCGGIDRCATYRDHSPSPSPGAVLMIHPGEVYSTTCLDS